MPTIERFYNLDKSSLTLMYWNECCRFSHGSGMDGYDHDSETSSEASEDEEAQDRRPVSHREKKKLPSSLCMYIQWNFTHKPVIQPL